MARPWHLAFLLLAFAGCLRGAEPILKIVGLDQTLAFSAEEFAALPHTELKALEPHEKKERLYAGVIIHDLLVRAGAPFGENVRGPALQLGVLVRSRDGYAVLFALAEFDESFSNRTLLLADREDGQPPPASAAPLRLVAPGDKRGTRWARMVTSIEIVQVGAATGRLAPKAQAPTSGAILTPR